MPGRIVEAVGAGGGGVTVGVAAGVVGAADLCLMRVVVLVVVRVFICGVCCCLCS